MLIRLNILVSSAQLRELDKLEAFTGDSRSKLIRESLNILISCYRRENVSRGKNRAESLDKDIH